MELAGATSTPDLPTFLLARIAEDEELARRAGGTYRWQTKAPPRWIVGETNNDGIRREDGIPVCGHSWPHEMEHIACWDPARVLAECEAKRRIMDEHKPYRRIYGVGCNACLLPRQLPPDAPGWPCMTLRALALPYADHPDYRQEWKP